LLEAMANVWEMHPEAQLLLAGGRTSYSQQIRTDIARFTAQQQPRITVLDDYPETLKPELLAASDIFVLPSGQESFGIAFVEAWACGTPVIGCRSGAISSVIDEGRDGLLVPYGDPDALAQAILELLDDPHRRAKMGRAGRQKVLEHYTWEIIAERVRAVYGRVIASRASGSAT
jgi:glycosyltransferase involved in cell wall biosynthesis